MREEDQPNLTSALSEEWFEPEEESRTVMCHSCGSVVVRSMRERHWLFHLQVTGNVHV